MDNFQISFILLLLSLFLLLLEFNKFRKITFVINLIILSLLLNFSLNSNFNHLLFLSNELWRDLVMFLVLLIFVVLINIIKDLKFEVIFLYIMVLLGSLMIILCDNLIILYLGLELQTFSLFILISKNRVSVKSSESALKYFILGALSSGLFLLGVSFIFSAGLSLNLKEILTNCSYDKSLIKISFSLISLSLFFKLAIFPLHFWIPDIYEGSSWETVALISTIPKISVLTIILQIVSYSDFFIICGVISIIVGSLGAMNQTKMKRLLAYSGISHIGFIILGVGLVSNQGYEASFVYLFIYMITMLGVFSLIYNSTFSKNYFIVELGGLSIVNKILALTWLIFFLSIAGIPPLAGFISKWFILASLVNFNYLIPVFIGVIFSAIAAGYYLRVVKITYFQKKSSYLIWEDILKVKEPKSNIVLYILAFIVYINISLIIHPTSILGSFYLSFNYFF